MPRGPISSDAVARIRKMAKDGMKASNIATAEGVSQATVSKYLSRRGLSDKDRFEEKFLPEPNSGCWLWHGAYSPNGRGGRPYATVNGRQIPASRAAWLLYCGEITDASWVLHNCHNEACVNPEHLRLGSPKENTADMYVVGRDNRGNKRRAMEILSQKDSGAPQSTVAKNFNVNPNLVSRIWSGARWARLQEANHAK